MTDISKELAELLGVEPEYFGKNLKTGELFLCELNPNKNDCVYCEVECIEKYPSLTQPENFVKLLEVMFKYDFNFKARATYVESVMHAALAEAKVNEDFRKDLQQVGWIY